jgi:hypothetical protein
MWIQAVYYAISHVEYEMPGLVDKVANLNPEDDWSDDDWNNYGSVAAAIVEPFVFSVVDKTDEEMYYNMCEMNGFGSVRANIMGNVSESWIKVIDLVEQIGY